MTEVVLFEKTFKLCTELTGCYFMKIIDFSSGEGITYYWADVEKYNLEFEGMQVLYIHIYGTDMSAQLHFERIECFCDKKGYYRMITPKFSTKEHSFFKII